MNELNYVTGDATEPQGEGLKIIVHVCNDIGLWGSGFVMALSAVWSKPEESYRAMSDEERTLGNVHLVGVEDDIIVANLIGQHNVGPKSTGFDGEEKMYPPIRYSAIAEGLRVLNEAALVLQKKQGRPVSIHMPRIGSARAGGNWEFIERLIQETTTVPVTVYDFPTNNLNPNR